jgi:hypothetical protein
MTAAAPAFLLISVAVARLEAGMFGGNIKRPDPVEAIKKLDPRISVGFGPHRQKAASAIYQAMMAGSLAVHVLGHPDADGGRRPLHVPVDVLGLLIKSHGGLSDRPIRLPVSLLREKTVTPELFRALSNSELFMSEVEFESWYQQQKRRRRWPSQRESIKPRSGRPSKQTDELITSIKARVAEKTWSAADGIAKLAKLLILIGAPSRNTLRRAVDLLYEETGDPLYRIVPRKRAKSKPVGLQS